MRLRITTTAGSVHDVESGLTQLDDARNQILIAGATDESGAWVNPAAVVTIAVVEQAKETDERPKHNPVRRFFAGE